MVVVVGLDGGEDWEQALLFVSVGTPDNCLFSGLCDWLDAVSHALVGVPAGLSPCHTRWSIEIALVDGMSASSATKVAHEGKREVGRICFQ